MNENEKKLMKDVVDLENQLLEVLHRAPMHVGVMAMSRLIAAAGVSAGMSSEFMVRGIKLAYNTIVEGRNKECGHAQN